MTAAATASSPISPARRSITAWTSTTADVLPIVARSMSSANAS